MYIFDSKILIGTRVSNQLCEIVTECWCFFLGISMDLVTISQMNFQLNIPNISELESKYTCTEVMVNDIPWKIIMIKCEEEDESWLGVLLRCAKQNLTAESSYGASALFKLIPFDENLNAIEFDAWPNIFNSNNNLYGIRKWIQWNDLFDVNKKYIKNDKIKLDVTIKMADPNEENKSDIISENVYKSCEVGCMSIFRFTITNIDNLFAVRAPLFMMRNIPCDLLVCKHPSQSLDVLLYLRDKIPHKKKIVIKLVSAQSTKSIEQIMTQDGHTPLTSWDNLFKSENGFINDNSITIEVDTTIEGIKPDDNNFQIKSVKVKETAFKCPICFDRFKKQEISSLSCGHLFCTKCIKNSIKNRTVCPLCNKTASLQDLRRTFLPF